MSAVSSSQQQLSRVYCYQGDPYIHCGSDEKKTYIGGHHVWELNPTDPSQVGIRGEMVDMPELRKSKTIRNAFTISTSEFELLFAGDFCIGQGSMHVYELGGFMKAHIDSRLPDMERPKTQDCLQHCFTLVVTNDLHHFRVDGKSLYPKSCLDTHGHYYIVIFPINLEHEVLPITWGKRISFTFPVYVKSLDTLNPVKALASSVVYKHEPTDLYDQAREALIELSQKKKKNENRFQSDPSARRAAVLARLEPLNDPELLKLFCKYRKCYDDYMDSDRDHAPDWSPGPSDYTVKYLKACMVRVKELRLLREAAEEKKQQEQDVEFQVDVSKIRGRAVIALSGRYYKDSTVDNLTPSDKRLYDALLADHRQVVFVPVAVLDLNDRYSSNCFESWIYDKSTIQRLYDDEYGRPKSSKIVVEQVEFDDQGGYDLRYQAVMGALVIDNDQ